MKRTRWLIGRINKECHPERSEGSLRFFATLRMTMGVFWDFEIDEEKGIAFRKEF